MVSWGIEACVWVALPAFVQQARNRSKQAATFVAASRVYGQNLRDSMKNAGRVFRNPDCRIEGDGRATAGRLEAA
jgi:hypothetical protein